MPTKILADVPDDAPIYVTTNRSSTTKRIHIDPDCRYLKTATNPIVEKASDTYQPDTPVCEACAGNLPEGGTDLSIYMAAKSAGEADE